MLQFKNAYSYLALKFKYLEKSQCKNTDNVLNFKFDNRSMQHSKTKANNTMLILVNTNALYVLLVGQREKTNNALILSS